jgi:poly-D-alanine transfer protein DltD
MAKAGRNPCERVRSYYCKQVPDAAKCLAYDGIYKESEQDESAKMRSMIRDQCVTKIDRMKEEEGITLK